MECRVETEARLGAGWSLECEILNPWCVVTGNVSRGCVVTGPIMGVVTRRRYHTRNLDIRPLIPSPTLPQRYAQELATITEGLLLVESAY